MRTFSFFIILVLSLLAVSLPSHARDFSMDIEGGQDFGGVNFRVFFDDQIFAGLILGNYTGYNHSSSVTAIEVGYNILEHVSISVGGYNEVFELPLDDDERSTSQHPLMIHLRAGGPIGNSGFYGYGSLKYLEPSEHVVEHSAIGTRTLFTVGIGYKVK